MCQLVKVPMIECAKIDAETRNVELGVNHLNTHADQLLRAGCLIGADVREAQAAESRVDFIHKMKVGHKEAGETEYWLALCNSARTYPKPALLLGKIEEILKILNSIISKYKGGKQQLAHWHIG